MRLSLSYFRAYFQVFFRNSLRLNRFVVSWFFRRDSGFVQQEIDAQKAAELHELMITVTEIEDLGGDPLGDLARHIMQQISERKIELEMIRHCKVADV